MRVYNTWPPTSQEPVLVNVMCTICGVLVLYTKQKFSVPKYIINDIIPTINKLNIAF